MNEHMCGNGEMSEQDDSSPITDLLYGELVSLIDHQADEVRNINERIGWLIVFSALNVSTLIVRSFSAFRNLLLDQGLQFEWWLGLFALDISSTCWRSCRAFSDSRCHTEGRKKSMNALMKSYSRATCPRASLAA